MRGSKATDNNTLYSLRGEVQPSPLVHRRVISLEGCLSHSLSLSGVTGCRHQEPTAQMVPRSVASRLCLGVLREFILGGEWGTQPRGTTGPSMFVHFRRGNKANWTNYMPRVTKLNLSLALNRKWFILTFIFFSASTRFMCTWLDYNYSLEGILRGFGQWKYSLPWWSGYTLEWGSIDSPELPFNRPPKQKRVANYHVAKAEPSVFLVSQEFSPHQRRKRQPKHDVS